MIRSSSRISRPRRQTARQATQSSAVDAVKPWLIPQYWEFIHKYVDRALEHSNGELEASDIYNYLLSERMYLFVVRKPLICAAAVCEVVQYVRKKTINVVTMSGEEPVEDWAGALNDALIDWQLRIKADGVEASVRKGLAEKMVNYGYKQIYVRMYLDGRIVRK